MAQVERGGRLVEQQDRRPLGQHPGEVGAGGLTARQRVDGPVGEPVEADLGQGLLDDLGRRGAAPVARRAAVGVAAHLDHLADGEGEADPGTLGQHGATPGQLPRRPAPHRPAAERDLAAGGREVAGQHAEERALARPVRADQCGQLARRQHEVDAAQHGPTAERDAHVRQRQLGARRRPPDRRAPAGHSVVPGLRPRTPSPPGELALAPRAARSLRSPHSAARRARRSITRR